MGNFRLADTEITGVITEEEARRLGKKAAPGTSFRLPGSSVTYFVTKWKKLDPPEPIKRPRPQRRKRKQ